MKKLFSVLICVIMCSSTYNVFGQSDAKVQAPYAQSVIVAEKGASTTIGNFEEVTLGLWQSSINGQSATYIELGRDQWSIALKGRENGEDVHINLWTEKVMLNGAERYAVLSASADVIENTPGSPVSTTTAPMSTVSTTVSANVAKGKTARQSSTYSAGPGKSFPAALALDGIKEGVGKLTHTQLEAGAWWEVDLGERYDISAIRVFNATDHPQRMNNFTILVSDTPFTGNVGGVAFVSNENAPNPTKTYSGNAKGRYVRLFLNGTNYLTIHEVEVLGTLSSGGATTPSMTSVSTGSTPPPATTVSTIAPPPPPAVAPVVSARESINAYINGLNYDIRKMLTTLEDGASESFPDERSDNGNAVTICTQEDEEASAEMDKISLINPSRTIFPGALIYGDTHLANGSPRSVSIDRAPMTITLLLPGSSGESGSVKVDKPAISTMNSARNTLIENWFRDKPEYTNSARQDFSMSRVYNSDQIAIDLGFNAKWTSGNASVKAAMNYDSNKEVIVAFFKQVFYTIACDKPTTPADFFAPEASLSSIQNIVSNDEPPAYVKSIDYGRMIMVRMETSRTVAGANLEAAFAYATGENSVGGDLKASYKKVLENSSFRLFALGGNAQNPMSIKGTDLQTLKNVIYDDAIFRKDNAGEPLSYTVNYLKKDVTAKVYSSLDYKKTNCVTYPNGQIVLKHGGGYVGRFIVTWQIDGKQCDDCRYESGKQANGWKQTIDIPADAKNLKILGQFGGIGTNNWQEIMAVTETGPTNCTYLIRGNAFARKGQKIDPEGKVVREWN